MCSYSSHRILSLHLILSTVINSISNDRLRERVTRRRKRSSPSTTDEDRNLIRMFSKYNSTAAVTADEGFRCDINGEEGRTDIHLLFENLGVAERPRELHTCVNGFLFSASLSACISTVTQGRETVTLTVAGLIGVFAVKAEPIKSLQRSN